MRLKPIAYIGLLIIFTAGVLGRGWVTYNGLREETRQANQQVAHYQKELARVREDYTLLYDSYKLVNDALNQTSAKALEYRTQLENLKRVGIVVYKYPNTPPYTPFPDPIDFDTAFSLLYGMKTSHEAVLNMTFTSPVGFGIDDKEFQLKVIKWYDQLIDYLWRHR